MRRAAAIAAVLSLSTLGLTACGDDSEGDQGSVEVGGEFGKSFEVDYSGTPLERKKTEVDVVVEGDGEELVAGDKVLVSLYVGSGYDGSAGSDSYADDSGYELITVGETLPALDGALEGQTIGSRVAVLAAPKDAWGATGNAALGVGNEDTAVFVLDLVATTDGEPVDVKPSEVPAAVGGASPTGFDFTGATEPTVDLQRAYLTKGTGPVVKAGQTVTAEYVGVVWGGKKPFDSSFDAKGPKNIEFKIADESGIQGWVQGLEGVPVGSRIELVIPSYLGYGSNGRAPSIKGGDTLVFVIDVVSAK